MSISAMRPTEFLAARVGSAVPTAGTCAKCFKTNRIRREGNMNSTAALIVATWLAGYIGFDGSEHLLWASDARPIAILFATLLQAGLSTRI